MKRARLAICLFFAAFTAICWSSVAAAGPAIVHDADSFSVDLGSVPADPVCVVMPIELSDFVACEGIDQSGADAITKSEPVLALAFLKVSGGQILFTVTKRNAAHPVLGPNVLKDYEASFRTQLQGIELTKLTVAPLAMTPSQIPFSIVTAEMLVQGHVGELRKHLFFSSNAEYSLTFVAAPALGNEVREWEKRVIPSVHVKVPARYDQKPATDPKKEEEPDLKAWLGCGLAIAFAIGGVQKWRAARANKLRMRERYESHLKEREARAQDHADER